MSSEKQRFIATKVTLKVSLEDLRSKINRYPPTVSIQHRPLYKSVQLIIVTGLTNRIRIDIQSEYKEEVFASCKLVNKDEEKSIIKDYPIVRVRGLLSVLSKSTEREYITLEQALDEKKGWLDSDGHITLEATVMEPFQTDRTEVQQELIENLFKYVRTENNLTVCSGDGKEYKMNEQIFACHSEFLATLLKYKDNGRVVFKSVPSNVMDEFIFYLNNGSINKSAELVIFDLAELAHMYDLRKLFELIEPFFINQIKSGQLSRVMEIAKQFDSVRLFRAIGGIEKVSEELLSGEGENFTIEVHGEKLSINQTFLALKYPLLAKYKDEMTSALNRTTLQAAKGLIRFLKTSQVDDLSECLFEYAYLAGALQLTELSSLVEQHLIFNLSKYDRTKVKDIAVTMRSVKIFGALAACPKR